MKVHISTLKIVAEIPLRNVFLLVAGIVIATSGFWPWLTKTNEVAYDGFQAQGGSGAGFMLLALGLVSLVLSLAGFTHYYRYAAVGQAITGFAALLVCVPTLLEHFPGVLGTGVWLALVASIALFELGIYSLVVPLKKEQGTEVERS